MCLFVHLTADHALPVIQRDELGQPLYVVRSAEPTARGREMSSSHTYYVGSHIGCGCGFYHEEAWEHDVTEERVAFARLKAYLQEAVKHGPVRLIAYWGEPGPVVCRQSVSAEQFDVTMLSPAWHEGKCVLLDISS
jgi:hypothetical protein